MNDGAEHEIFYADLVRRNAGIISAEEQRMLRTATIVVVGCGSLGGAAVEPLVRMGAEHFRLVEPSNFQLADLNQQRAGLADVGANKGTVLARRAHTINPYVRVEVQIGEVDVRTVAGLVTGSDIVLDGIERGSPAAMRQKATLHQAAALARLPVVAGHSCAGRQTILTCDYRRTQRRLSRTAGFVLPHAGQESALDRSGVVYTTDVFGAIATRSVVDLLAGRSVRRRIVVDVHRLSRPWLAQVREAVTSAVRMRSTRH